LNYPAVARSFAKDMRAYHATNDTIKREEIAARQAWLLSEHLGPREKKLRLIDVRQMFVEMKDYIRWTPLIVSGSGRTSRSIAVRPSQPTCTTP
jgi:hypothetical protein